MSVNISNKLELPNDQYFFNGDKKTGICLHHTVGGTAASSVAWWKQDKQMVGTPFIIDHDGTIYQVFDPKGWAWEFGLKWGDPFRTNFEKRFIGIEIASEGGLIESDGNLYCFNTVNARTLKNRSEVYDYGKPYRGFRYFDKYEDVQVDSVVQLVNYLIDMFGIERKIPKNYTDYYGLKLKDFKGIIGHVNVRDDKTDPNPDPTFWQRVIKGCNLQLVDIDTGIPEPSVVSSNGLTKDEIDKLFQDNLNQFSIMSRGAGNMVKGLLWELQDEDRDTYIRLKNAASNGFIVNYDLVQGDPKLVAIAAQSLGFKSWDNNRLEVYNA